MTAIRKTILQITYFQGITDLTTDFCTSNDRFGFKAMNEWLKFCNPEYDQKEMLNKVLELLVLIRKDLQNNSKLKVRDILLNIMQSEEEIRKFQSLNKHSPGIIRKLFNKY